MLGKQLQHCSTTYNQKNLALHLQGDLSAQRLRALADGLQVALPGRHAVQVIHLLHKNFLLRHHLPAHRRKPSLAQPLLDLPKHTYLPQSGIARDAVRNAPQHHKFTVCAPQTLADESGQVRVY